MKTISVTGDDNVTYLIKTKVDKKDNSNYNLMVSIYNGPLLIGGCRAKKDATRKDLINLADLIIKN